MATQVITDVMVTSDEELDDDVFLAQGAKGWDGWTPQFGLVSVANRTLMKVTGWAGGQGIPPETGLYVSGDGFTSDVSLAISVKGDKGDIPTKSDLELDKVENTSDAEKPVSQPQQQALNRKPEVYATIAELRTVKGTYPNQRVEVQCHSSMGDNGGNSFFWHAADSTSVDNNGTIIGSGNGRWKALTNTLTPEMFGAVGDGVVDETAILQKILDIPGKRYQLGQNKSYGVSASLKLKNDDSDLAGNNATLVPLDGLPISAPVLTTVNSTALFNNQATLISVVAGVPTLTIPDAASLAVGQIIVMEGPLSFSGGETYYFGHLSLIKSIQGTTVTLYNTPEQTFTATKISSYAPLNKLRVSDVNISGRSKAFFGIILNYCIDSTITRGTFRGGLGGEVAILMGKSINGKVRDTNISGFTNLTTGAAYGIALHGHNLLAEGNNVEGCKHAITSSDRIFLSTGIKYHNNIVRGVQGMDNNPPLDFHGNARGECVGNTIYAYGTGMNLRSGGINVHDNTFYVYETAGSNIIPRGIKMFGSLDHNINITYNKFYLYTNKGVGAIPISIESPLDGVSKINNLRIQDNYFNQGIVQLRQLGTGIHVSKNTFDSIEENTGHYGALELVDCLEAWVTENTFINRHASLFNFTVALGSGAKAVDIRDNTVYLPNNTTRIQFRIDGERHKVRGNTFHSTANIQYISDSSATKVNLLKDNKRYDGAVFSEQGYGFLPAASGFFEGHTISLISGNQTVAYLCVKTGASAYAWQAVLTSAVTAKITTTQDLEFSDQTRGDIYKDRSNGKKYRLSLVNGQVVPEEVV